MKIIIVDTINNIPSHKQFQDLAATLVLEGHKVVHLSDTNRPKYSGVKVVPYQKSQKLKTLQLFFKTLRQFKPDTVISTFSASSYIDVLSWLFNFKWIAFLQSDFFNDHFQNRFRFRQVGTLFVVSSPMQYKTARMYLHLKDRIQVIPNSFVFSEFEEVEKKNVILHVGVATLNAQGKFVKGTDVLIEAYRQLPLALRDTYELWILGDGKPMEELKEKSSDILSVKYLGRIPHSEVLECMQYAKIFVLPSRNEAFGNVFIEAMQYGCSLIGTEGTGAVDIIEEGNFGSVVPQEDSQALASAMTHVMGHYQYNAAYAAYRIKRQMFGREAWVSTMKKYLTD